MHKWNYMFCICIPSIFFTYVYIYTCISIYLPFYSLLILLPKRRICDNNLDSWSTCGISNCDGLIMLLLYIFIDLTFVRSDNLLLMECDLYKSSFSGVTCTNRHFLVWPVQIVIFWCDLYKSSFSVLELEGLEQTNDFFLSFHGTIDRTTILNIMCR